MFLYLSFSLLLRVTQSTSNPLRLTLPLYLFPYLLRPSPCLHLFYPVNCCWPHLMLMSVINVPLLYNSSSHSEKKHRVNGDGDHSLIVCAISAQRYEKDKRDEILQPVWCSHFYCQSEINPLWTDVTMVLTHYLLSFWELGSRYYLWKV